MVREVSVSCAELKLRASTVARSRQTALWGQPGLWFRALARAGVKVGEA